MESRVATRNSWIPDRSPFSLKNKKMLPWKSEPCLLHTVTDFFCFRSWPCILIAPTNFLREINPLTVKQNFEWTKNFSIFLFLFVF